jgi:hypothetical protein
MRTLIERLIVETRVSVSLVDPGIDTPGGRG